MVASTAKATSTDGPPVCPSTRSTVEVWVAGPANVIVQLRNGSTQVNASGPAPSTAGRPSEPSTGQAGPSVRTRNARPSGKATFTCSPCSVHWEATASMPIRGSPRAPRSSETQKLTESRISGLSGRSGNMFSRAGSSPPVRSTLTRVPRSHLVVQSCDRAT